MNTDKTCTATFNQSLAMVVPTITEWRMTFFSALAGPGALYCLRGVDNL